MKTFLFDIGHVLVDFDFSELFAVLSRQAAAPQTAFSEEDEQQRDAVERGLISDAEWVDYLNRTKGLGWSVSDLVSVWQTLFRVNAAGYALFRKAVECGARVYTLSNIAQHHMDAIEANWSGFFDGAAGLFLSYRIGARKPHPAIYEHALNELGVAPEECFFIDDLPDNIGTARRFGIHAHRFIPENHEAVETAAQAFFGW